DHVSWRDELPGGSRSIGGVANYLCEIKESQIRSGLHVLGERPAGEQQIDFLLSLLRLPSGGRPGLLTVLAGGRELASLTPAERDLLESEARRWLKHVTSQKNAGDSLSPVEQPLDQPSDLPRGNFGSLTEGNSDSRAQLDNLATFVRHQLIP